jgi:ketosteroid isomerase-like protein
MNDIENIRRVLAEYCYTTDSGDIEAWLDIFSDDIVWTGGAFGGFSGKAEARAYRSASVGGAVNFRHFISNSIIDIQGIRASARSYVQVFNQSAAVPVLAFSGLYDDRFEKNNDRWRIKTRHLLAHPKDLSRLPLNETNPA